MINRLGYQYKHLNSGGFIPPSYSYAYKDSQVVDNTLDFILRNSASSAGNNSLRNSAYSAGNNSVGNNLQPPVYTKTWFHTGFFRGRNRISRLYEEEYYQGDTEAWTLPDTILPEGLKPEEAREACRALKGSPLRIEIYAQETA